MTAAALFFAVVCWPAAPGLKPGCDALVARGPSCEAAAKVVRDRLPPGWSIASEDCDGGEFQQPPACRESEA